jgi:hypothetical protein
MRLRRAARLEGDLKRLLGQRRQLGGREDGRVAAVLDREIARAWCWWWRKR